MEITLRNSFHNTSYDVKVSALPARLSIERSRAIQRALCGVADCRCGGVFGEQEISVETDYTANGEAFYILHSRS